MKAKDELLRKKKRFSHLSLELLLVFILHQYTLKAEILETTTAQRSQQDVWEILQSFP